MAIAFTAWLIAAAPIAWSSAVPFSRTTPASAPATAVGFDLAATLRTSIGRASSAERRRIPPHGRGGDRLLSRAFLENPPSPSRPLPLRPAHPLNGPGPAGPVVHVEEDGVQL